MSSEPNDWVTPQQLFHPYFSNEFLEGRTTKSYNPYKDRDLCGLFLMLVNMDYQYVRDSPNGRYAPGDLEYWKAQEEWAEHYLGTKGLSLDPGTVTKLLYPKTKDLSNSGQYKKIRRLFKKLEDINLIESYAKEERVTDYGINWYGLYLLILDFVYSAGSSEKKIIKFSNKYAGTEEDALTPETDRRFEGLRMHAAAHPRDIDLPTPTEWKGVAVYNEQVVSFIREQFRSLSFFFEYSEDLEVERDLLTFEMAVMGMASRMHLYLLNQIKLARENFENFLDDPKAVLLYDEDARQRKHRLFTERKASFRKQYSGSELNLLKEGHEEKQQNPEDAYYIAFWHFMCDFDEYFFLFEGMSRKIMRDAAKVLRKIDGRAFSSEFTLEP